MASSDNDFLQEAVKNIRKVQALGDEGSHWCLYQSFSPKDGGVIAVLGVDFDAEICVLDYDGTSPSETTEARALGVSKTPNGSHIYVRSGELLESLETEDDVDDDQMYQQLCGAYGFYTERLFNADGTPRELPEILVQDPVMVAHRAAFLMAQELALDLCIDKPGEFLEEKLTEEEIDRLEGGTL